jgi:hypothetical protein
VHALHEPPPQTRFVPHDVPLGTSVSWSTQVEVPVEHDVSPLWQGFELGAHDRPAVHALHVPPLQTSLVPHDVPLAALVLRSVHAWVVQSKLPLWQTLVGVHGAPALHAVHDPFSQTFVPPSVPHAVPLGTLPVGGHWDTPVEHDVTPVWHELAVHGVPAVQGEQVPLLQTSETPASLVPHDVPLASSVVV